MPKSLLFKNKREIHNFTNLKDEEVIIVDGTAKQREAQLSDPRGKVWLVGFKRFADDWERMTQIHPEISCLMVDEWHMGGFKNAESVRSKQLFKCMRKFKFFLAMSGTLISGRLDSCYTAIHVIEPRYYANHYSFLAQHAITDDYGTVLSWFNHEKLGRIFMRHCIRRSFESVYGKEAKELQKELVPMDAKSRAAYQEFEDKALLELEDEFLDGVNPAVNAMRCRQIMGHPHTMKLLKDGVLTGKDERLEIHVEDHLNRKAPLIIFASLMPEQERIAELCTKWGLKVGLINSSVSPKKRGQIDIDFQNGLLDCVVGSPATAAVGFNWGHVDHIIFASIDYDNTNFVQAYRRTIRDARKTPVLITVLEYENSIDQRLFAIVDKKSRDLSKVDQTYEKLTLSSI
jgi:SNF2 family DNA or RNA helicase